jgi:cysteine-rich repeat protein
MLLATLQGGCSWVVEREESITTGAICSPLVAPRCDNKTLVRCQSGQEQRTLCAIGCNSAVGACSSCGNGLVEPGETCDDGNGAAGDGCRATCQTERCGDGVVDTAEQCDDGNLADGDLCTAGCQIAPDRLVSTAPGSQSTAAVAAAPDGSFLAVWLQRVGNTTPLGFEVHAQRFSSTGGPLDIETTLDTGPANAFRYSPSVAANADNTFLVVWSHSDGSVATVRARRVASNGSLLDPTDRVVSTTTINTNPSPAVTVGADGAFVVAWEARPAPTANQDASVVGSGIYVRRMGPDGQFLDASDFLLSARAADMQGLPAIAAKPNNSVVALWSVASGAPAQRTYRVRGRHFGFASGASFGDSEEAVDVEAPSTFSLQPSIAATRGGVVFGVWEDRPTTDHNNHDIRGRLLSPAGHQGFLDAANVLVSTSDTRTQRNCFVATPPEGPFLTVWEDHSARNVSDAAQADNVVIRGRRFGLDGVALEASDFVVSTSAAGRQERPRVAAASDGTYFVVWETSGGDIRGRFLPPDFRQP